MTQWPPHTGDTPPNPADTLFVAIRGDAHDAFYASIKQVKDLNQNSGLFLRTAALVRNNLFMKELVSHGADIPYTLEAVSREMAQIPRHHVYDDYDDDYSIRYNNRDDEKSYRD